MKVKPSIQIICGKRALAQQYLGHFQKSAGWFHLPSIIRFTEARQLTVAPSIFLLDESGIERQSKQTLKLAANHLARFAPLVVVASPGRQSDLAALLILGLADFVARTGKFVPVAVALAERRMRFPANGAVSLHPTGGDGDFGEILRHELNNPLTGILGNAEMLLAKRDHLPKSAIERLETIAHLAVRLRETVRRLSSAAELRHAG